MKILDYTVFSGRNIYSHLPIIKMILDLGEYADTPTNRIPGFNEKILKAFPGLKTNHCGAGYEGGFLEKLKSGTYLAHVLEHVILEIQFMLGYDVRYGKARMLEEPSKYYIVYEFANEVCGLETGKAAVYLLNSFIENEKVHVSDFLDYLKTVSRDAELGPSTSAILKEAQKRGIPVSRFGHESMITLGYGKYRRVLQATLTDATSCISVDIASNKQLTKKILNDNGIPAPYGKLVFSEISAILAARHIGDPVVIKPHDANQGKGVHLNLTTDADIKAAFRDAVSYSNGVIVEQFIKGRDFRVLVVGGKVRAVAHRLPASVIGDGIHTIKELIDIINEDENRGEDHEKPLTKIKLDTVSIQLLKKMGMSPKYIPEAEEVVKLRENGNLSTGGIAIDFTDNIHPENADLAVLAAQALDVDIAGIDFVTEDISQPIRKTGGAIVEVNTAPGIRMHLYPCEGTPRNVAKDIIDYMYPNDDVLNFPIVSVTGTNGKTTTSRLIAHVLEKEGRSVGLTTTSGTYINGKRLSKGDHTGPVSAKVLLGNKNIDAAVLETARGGIIRGGLGYDLADVGVITNIAEDHINDGEVETLEDLALVKSLVVEAVKKNGKAVLNADDPMTKKIIKRVTCQPIFFTNDLSYAMREYGENKTYVYNDGLMIRLHTGEESKPVAAITDIPVTQKGTVRCMVENCMAAVCALFALDISIDIIRTGLQTFVHNPGRFNLFEMKDFKIMLDYAHNPSGFTAAIEALKAIPANRLVGIIGVPGDRPDASVYTSGEICAEHFQKIYIKEDQDLRGRKQGEVASIMYDAAIGKGFPKEEIAVIYDEKEALKTAVNEAKSGDLIVEFYEELDPLVDYIHDYLS